MPAHIIFKEGNGKNGYYLVDGYRVRSLKTKSKREAEAKLKEYTRGRPASGRALRCGSFMPSGSSDRSRHWFGRPVERSQASFRASRLAAFWPAFSRHVNLQDFRAWQAELLKTGLKVKDGAKHYRLVFPRHVSGRPRRDRGIGRQRPVSRFEMAKVKATGARPAHRQQKRRVLACFAECEPWYYPFMKFQFRHRLSAVRVDSAHVGGLKQRDTPGEHQ